MRYLFKTIDGPELHLYPFGDWHIGSAQCNIDFIKRLVKRVADDPLGLWIYMGDGGEVVTKTSKGSLFEQTLSPGDQIRAFAKLVEPVADKGLVGVCGNHGRRVDMSVGMGWDEVLCSRIGIPYAGVAAFIGFQLNNGGKRSAVSVYVHHGAGGSITPVGKMNAATKPQQFVNADIILTGHTHAAGEIFPPRIIASLDNQQKRIRWTHSRCYATGSAYDSRSGYAEEKMYPPIVPEQLCLTIKQVRKTKNKKERLSIDTQMEIIRDHPDDTHNPHEEAKWSGVEDEIYV
jgi:predicted phosphodiesterase